MSRTVSSLLVLILLSILGSAPSAQVLHVDADAPGGGNGSSWASAIRELQVALALAVPPAVTEIWVAEGTYKPGSSSLASFALPSGVSVYGGFNGTETSLTQRDPVLNVTVLDGDLFGNDRRGFRNYTENARSVVTAAGGQSAHLDGFTVRGGSLGSGGGLSLRAGQVSLANLIVQENLGGGAWIAAATVTIRDCAFADNRATGGAGLVLSDPADATVLRCSFDRQRATCGGGLSIGGVNTGRVSVVECQFRDASVTSGGGISLSSITFLELSVERSTFERNEATEGAGILVASERPGRVSVSDSFFADNTATAGGGIALDGERITNALITGCRFERNDACAGGALFVHGGIVEVMACEFRDNHMPPNCGVGRGGGAIRTNTGLDRVDVSRSLFLNSDHGLLWGENSSDLTATLCTFANEDNLAPAIRLVGRTSLALDSCIVWGSASEQIDAADVASLAAVYSDVRAGGAGLPGTGNFELDPSFVDPAAGDLRLSSLSPCIDAGNPSHRFAGSDLDRDSRLLDGDSDGRVVADMGADEFGPIHLEVTGTPVPGGTLTYETTGRPGLTALMTFGRPGQQFFRFAGTLFLDPTGLIVVPWPTTPSSVSAVVPPGASGLYHVQEIAIGGGSVVLSNYVSLQF